GDQVRKGATTVCETYECSAWASQNMKMLGSLDKFFFSSLAGITPQLSGYRRVSIRPQPVGDLNYVSATQETVRGRIEVDWKISGVPNNVTEPEKNTVTFYLDVSVPAGVDAKIYVPTLGLSAFSIAESGVYVWKQHAYIPGTSGLHGARHAGDAI